MDTIISFVMTFGTQKAIIRCLKDIIEWKKDIDLEGLTKLICLDDCSAQDIIELKDMALFHIKVLFDSLSRKVKLHLNYTKICFFHIFLKLKLFEMKFCFKIISYNCRDLCDL